MHSGQVSRGKLLARFKDCDRLAEREGAPTLVEAYEPIRSEPFYDRVYRERKENGGMVEVWCRAQPIAEVPGLDPTSLPWAADLFMAPPRREKPSSAPPLPWTVGRSASQLELL